MTSKNTICLWYDGTALDAAQFYAKTFPDSVMETILHAPGEWKAYAFHDGPSAIMTLLAWNPSRHNSPSFGVTVTKQWSAYRQITNKIAETWDCI